MHFVALTRRRLTGLAATVVCAAALIPVVTGASASAETIPAITSTRRRSWPTAPRYN